MQMLVEKLRNSIMWAYVSIDIVKGY